MEYVLHQRRNWRGVKSNQPESCTSSEEEGCVHIFLASVRLRTLSTCSSDAASFTSYSVEMIAALRIGIIKCAFVT